MKKLYLLILFSIMVSSYVYAQSRPSVMQIKALQNISELRATRPTIEGTWAFVMGYNSPGDGGGGDFSWNSTDTRADNNGTIIAATGVPIGRWNRVMGRYDNVEAKWFGIFANPMSETPPDQSAAIQALIDSVAGSCDILFDTGLYGIGTTLTPAYYISGKSTSLGLIGRGAFTTNETYANDFLRKTVFYALPTLASGAAILDINPGDFSVNYGTWGVNLQNISFIGQPTKDQVGLRASGLTDSSITNCQFQNLAFGIDSEDNSVASNSLQYAYGSRIVDTSFNGCNTGYRWTGPTNNLVFERCKFKGASTSALIVQLDTTGPVIDKCYFENNFPYDITVYNSGGLNVTNSWFEGGPSAHIKYVDTGFVGPSRPYLSVTNNFMRNARIGAAYVLELTCTLQNEPAYAIPGGDLPVVFAFNKVWGYRPFPSDVGFASQTLYLAVLGTDTASNTVSNISSIGNQLPAFQFEYTPSVNLKDRISIFGDGPYGKFKFGQTHPHATGTLSFTTPQEYYPGSFQFNFDTGTFQGVASTTIGWNDI